MTVPEAEAVLPAASSLTLCFAKSCAKGVPFDTPIERGYQLTADAPLLLSHSAALEEMIHMRMADDHSLDMALKVRLPDQPG